PRSFPFEDRLDGAKPLAHLVRPSCSGKLGAQKIETLLERCTPFGSRKPFDSVRDLRNDWLRDAHIPFAQGTQPVHDPRFTLHQCREGVRIQEISQNRLGDLDRRCLRIVLSMSSTSAAISGETSSSRSKKSGDQSEPVFNSCS